MTSKAREVAQYLYDETNKNATSMTHIIPFEIIKEKFDVDISNKEWELEIREAMDIDNVINIDVDNVRKHVVVMIYQKEPIKEKVIDLPICFVHLIEGCLETIRDHDLFALVFGSYADKDEEEARKVDLQIVLDEFCKPLDELDEDVQIIID